MFKRNKKHQQTEIFDWDINVSKQAKLDKSIWHTIRTDVFEKVDESIFAVLYPSHTGRPNAPINEIVTLLMIKELNDWTYRELESHMTLHIGVLFASGVNFGQSTVSLRTLTSFVQSLREYYDLTGTDLFNQEFNRLVSSQIEEFKVNTKIARVDSTQLATNVCACNRIQLIIESIKRLNRVVGKSEQEFLKGLCPDYLKYEADNYVSLLKPSGIEDEFSKLGHCCYVIINEFGDKYSHLYEWQMFIRIFKEQFVIGDSSDNEPKITKKSSEDKKSDDIRAIDDPEATLRHKSGKNNLGFVGNAIETADPEADLNLIADVTVCTNITSDGTMLNEALDSLVNERLTELCELHFDGGYGGPIVDSKLDKYSINVVQTGIAGAKCDASMSVEKSDDSYFIICAHGQRVQGVKLSKSHKATFDKAICKGCPHFAYCPIDKLRNDGDFVYYLKDIDLLKRLRLSYIKTIPIERRTLRSGVEATIRQFKCHTKAGKTRLRGLFRHKLWFTMLALAINIKRINDYKTGVRRKRRARHILFFLRHIMAQLSQISSFLAFTGLSLDTIILEPWSSTNLKSA